MNLIIVGAGAAGMMAAYSASLQNKFDNITILEKNEKAGKKIYITGKGRCNYTNFSDRETILSSIISNSKFMYSSFSAFNNYDVFDFFESNGVPSKIERGNRVFPVSDKASDIIRCLTKVLSENKVKIVYNTNIVSIKKEEDLFYIKDDNGKKYISESVIIATGGASYPSTGSSGDGYDFARAFGLEVKEPEPSLVPFNAKEDYVKELQGLSLKNITAYIYDGEKMIYEEFGEMLFTHFGVSGPIILKASSYIGNILKKKSLKMFIDFKPALDDKALDRRLLKDFEEAKNKAFKNSLGGLLPTKMIPVIIQLSKINPDKKVNEITKEERLILLKLLKHFPFTLTGLRGMNEAIITRGGVLVSQINPKTMECKNIKGLFFAGEVLDVDALTGGYNLQVAWSSGYAAGKNA
ncbi:hypothetical protein SAMN05216249_10239 [Acetitomaculum ruminis DSM 5522]|uniref:NAD(P)/FAD-dependent oxidoreductase n=1 Tax=Acetitomaculum ruminis DSM 5522 TaxID=1120918 RepID=A0A1I0VJG2_9FIRM|nr:NAD(P)/FAD-dependent oxidoreductase [Acetitomaculum ruminis]SFA76338.1 hypothetical protein SAMN05216249_10239 [Acetitomaculum ruminis DSM 5522]